MLNDEMKGLIKSFSAGSVATINADGTPSVSPKATFVVIDNRTIAYGNLRSPRTSANLRRNSAVEVCFTDIVRRRALRVTGTGESVGKSDAAPEVSAAFEQSWPLYVPHMSSFVLIHIKKVEAITSPAYDIGFSEEELMATNLEKLNALTLSPRQR